MFVDFNDGTPVLKSGLNNIKFTVKDGEVAAAEIEPDYRVWLLGRTCKLYAVTWIDMRVAVSQGKVMMYRAPCPNIRLGFNEDDLLVKVFYEKNKF